MAVLGRMGSWLSQRPYLLICLTYLMWSLNIVLGRHAAGHVPPVTLTTWRWLLATLILLPFAWPYITRDWPIIRGHLPILTILGVAGTTGYALFSYWGLQYTQAINGLLIQCSMPIVVGAVSYMLVGERLTAIQIVGIVISFIGVLAILVRGDLEVLRSISFNAGDIWFIGATLVFAVYSALMKKKPAMHWLSFLGIMGMFGVAAILPFYAWEAAHTGVPPLDAKTIYIVVYIAIFPSILAYICFNRGVMMIGPNMAAALYPLIIVFGTTVAILFLGERPQLYHVIGSALIVGGVLLATRQSRVAVT